MRKDNLNVKLPELSDHQKYKEWQTTIKSFLGTKHLTYFVDYFVEKKSFLLKNNSQEDTHVDVVISKLGDFMTLKQLNSDFVKRLTISVRRQVVTIERVELYHLESELLPDSLMNLAVDAVLLVVDKHQLIPIYEEKSIHATARAKLIKDIEEAKTVIRCALTLENVYLFESCNSVYDGFNDVCSHFEKDSRLERLQLKKQVRRLKSTSINSRSYLLSMRQWTARENQRI